MKIVALVVMAGTFAFAAPAPESGKLKTRLHPSYAKAAGLKRLNMIRSHVVLPFDGGPSRQLLTAFEREGIRVVGAIPGVGIVASVPDGSDVLPGSGPAQLVNKLSPLLPEGDGFAIVEFFPDVDMNDARRIVTEEGMAVLERPDLNPNQLLAGGSRPQFEALEKWDEVSYVFPASPDLVDGVPVLSCGGVETGWGPVGQYVAKMGEGWDGPGLGPADLGVFFGALTSRLPEGLVRSEIERALAQWSDAVAVNFSPVAAAGPRTVHVHFAAGNHGDGFAFDGPGKVLAHTFYPPPLNPESIAGDLHFDDDERWMVGSGVDVYSVALHELGHALGLAHSDQPGAVMYPYYRMATTLMPEDIAAIRTLYAARRDVSAEPPLPAAPSTPGLTIAVENTDVQSAVGSIRGTVNGGSGAVRVTWRLRSTSGTATGDRSWSVSGIQLQSGMNHVIVRADDEAGSMAERLVTLIWETPAQALQVAITSPAATGSFSATTPSITLQGTAAGAVRVTWTNSRGGSGTASGAANWSTGAVALRSGVNTITVTAHAASGATASASLEVNFATRDNAAPSIRIDSPSSTSVGTSQPSIIVRGAASDDTGVVEVAWYTSTGLSGIATGTEWWTTPAIPLSIGSNRITIRARDVGGNVSTRSVSVTRK